MAVATVESVFSIPHFARIDVSPEKKAEPNANISHIRYHPFIKLNIFQMKKAICKNQFPDNL